MWVYSYCVSLQFWNCQNIGKRCWPLQQMYSISKCSILLQSMIIEKYCLFLLLLLVVNLDNHPCQCINFALNCIIINLVRSCKVFPIYSSVLFVHDGWEFVRDQNWKDTRRLFMIRLFGWKMIWKIIWSVRRISQRKDDIALRSKFVKLFIIQCVLLSLPHQRQLLGLHVDGQSRIEHCTFQMGPVFRAVGSVRSGKNLLIL